MNDEELSNYEYYKEKGKTRLFDNFLSGFLPAFLIPLLIMIILIWHGGKGSSVTEILSYLWGAVRNMYFVHQFIFSLMVNMFLFLFFYKTERWNGCRGLVVATLSWVIFFVIRQSFS